MTALPAFMYHDPAKVLEQIEEATCKGCALKQSWVIVTTKTESCLLGRKVGRRCKKYVEERKKNDGRR